MSDIAAPKVAPGLLMRHYRNLSELEDQHRQLKRQISLQRAQAVQDGVDLNALKLMRSLERLDEATAATRLNNLRYYSRWCGFPIGESQGLLFMEPSPEEILDHDLWISEQDGRAAAKAGAQRASNPHPAGEALWQRWERGWVEADANEATVRRVLPEAAERPPGRRGRPPGARNKPKAAVVLTRLRRAAAKPQPQNASLDL